MTTVNDPSRGANAPELTKSLPPQHRSVTSRSDNRDMRPPSDLHARVSRGLVLRAALGALLAALTIAPIADAGTIAKGERGVFVSKGVGRQIFTGGGGVSYGVVFSGASLVVTDYSATRDMRVDSPVLATTNADGSRTYVPAGGTKSAAFRISGTLYRVTVTGAEHDQRRGHLRPPAGARQGHAHRQQRAPALERPGHQPRQGSEGHQAPLPHRRDRGAAAPAACPAGDGADHRVSDVRGAGS